MERVTGIGGVFLRAEDPAALNAWYAEHLGVAGGSGTDDGLAAGGRADRVERLRCGHRLLRPARAGLDDQLPRP